MLSRSVMSDCFWPQGLCSPSGPLSMKFCRKNSGMGSHSLLQGIFLTQESNPACTASRFFTIWAPREAHISLIPAFPSGSDGKESAFNAGDPGLIPGLGRSPGEGNGNPLQNSCLGSSMEGSLAGYSQMFLIQNIKIFYISTLTIYSTRCLKVEGIYVYVQLIHFAIQ